MTFDKIGLITYHSAYNYGSVFQAYATQEALRNLCPSVEVVNYRSKEQKKFYSLYRTEYGLNVLVKDLMQVSLHGMRKKRIERFENFLNKYLHLSKECTEPRDVYDLWDQYDVVISGSDQIWNKHSQELERIPWENMNPYLLVGFKGHKISYASSLANMTDDELDKIVSCIKEFEFISVRESDAQKRLSVLLNKEVAWVLDPTFLLTGKEWIDRLGIKKIKSEKYILYYSLGGIKVVNETVRELSRYADDNGYRLKIITPFVYSNAMKKWCIDICADAGPIEFLNLLYSADKIVTDSYHGTILGVNLHKDVYSLCGKGGSENRKVDILTRLGLQVRIVNDAHEFVKNEFEPIDFDEVDNTLNKLRSESVSYLCNAIH